MAIIFSRRVCRLLFLLYFLCAPGALAQSEGGHSGGGGGTSVELPNGQHVLLDLLMFDENFVDGPAQPDADFPQSPNANLCPVVPASRNRNQIHRFNIDRDQATALTRYAPFSQQRMGEADSPYQIARAILEESNGQILSSLLVAPILLGALQSRNTDWEARLCPFALTERYFLPVNLQEFEGSLKTVAYIDSVARPMRIGIWRDGWNEMGKLSQAALLLHETVRFAQLMAGSRQAYSEFDAQAVTALLFFCQSSAEIDRYISTFAGTGPGAQSRRLYFAMGGAVHRGAPSMYDEYGEIHRSVENSREWREFLYLKSRCSRRVFAAPIP